MSGAHTEAVLNKLTKPEWVQLLLKTEATLSKEIKETLIYLKKLEADIAVVRTVNGRLVERVVKTERQFWENALHSRRDSLEIIGILNSIGNSVIEETVRRVFKKIGAEIDERDVQACHRFKEKERTIVKFVNWKDCLQILRVKKELKSLVPTELDFPENTKIFINESFVLITEASWINAKN